MAEEYYWFSAEMYRHELDFPLVTRSWFHGDGGSSEVQEARSVIELPNGRISNYVTSGPEHSSLWPDMELVGRYQSHEVRYVAMPPGPWRCTRAAQPLDEKDDSP